MLQRIIDLSLRNRFAVMLVTCALVALGCYSLSRLPIDAFPDASPVQVQVNATAPALSPLEIEQQLALPIERALGGLPGLENVRSISKFGLTQVTATFTDDVDIYFARQQVGERLQAVEIPEGLHRPELGPVTTGLGEVFHYAVVGEGRSLTELTTIHDYLVKPQLATVPGVAEVNTWGGLRKQYHVLVDPSKLIQYDLTLDDVIEALEQNNRSVGGGNLVQSGELLLVHGLSLITNVEEIGNVVIKAIDGVPVRVRDVADAQEGHEIRRGAVTAQGRGEIVHGLGFMLFGENSHALTRRLEERVKEIARSLPEGVKIEVLYRRTELVDQVIATVEKNLAEGALLVIAILFIFLGNLRAGLIVASVIPLAMMFSFSAMLYGGIAASLLSLGAIDFGLVVDSAVILVENCARRFSTGAKATIESVRDAVLEVRRPTLFGELIILIVYVPILLLEGVEGKLFRPMALTVIFALSASLVLSLTVVPVLVSFLAKGMSGHKESIIMRAIHAIDAPIIRATLRFKWLVILFGIGAIAFGAFVYAHLGSNFIPRLHEQALAINTVRLAGVSLEESVRYGTMIEQFLLKRFPDEIRAIWSRTGTAQVATDPMGLEVSDVFLTLKPREEWTKAKTQEELTAAMGAAMAELPAMRSIFTQPIEMRMNELVAGIRSDVGIKIYGEDLEVLRAKAEEAEQILRAIPGAADVSAEQMTGQPLLEIRIDQRAIARYGVPAAHVLEIVAALGEIRVGEVREGQRRFDLVVRLADAYREDPEDVGRILVPSSTGERIPLRQLANIQETVCPSTITREWQNRRTVVQANVRNRDLSSFVSELDEKLKREFVLPAGYYYELGGQYEHLVRAERRLAIIIPLALLAILALLYLSTRSLRDTLIITIGAPLGAVGGVLALWIADLPVTISAAIGFIAVAGVSMLNGLVLVAAIRQYLGEGLGLDAAIAEARRVRLRPILMTAAVAALGFVPMVVNTGVGAEVQRPLAVVVIGGVLANNLLNLIVLPAVYGVAGRAKDQR